MPGLEPGIHLLTFVRFNRWMAGSCPAMTEKAVCAKIERGYSAGAMLGAAIASR
jgi:hypothetical protein